MNLVDLTHIIDSDIPVFPGDTPPKLSNHCTWEKDGFLESRLDISSHTGTHIDAPAHMLKNGKTLERFSLESFTGKGIVADISSKSLQNINIDDIIFLEKFRGKIDFILFNTGWSSFWKDTRYLKDFPGLTAETAGWLTSFHLKGIGIDTISIDRINSRDYSVHKILMEQNLLIIENLTNLKKIAGDIFTFFCMPVKFKQADGSPVRAFGITK